MLRMIALGLVIPLGVGVLSAMELGTPPRNAAPPARPAAETIAVVLPVAGTSPDVSGSQGALAKSDRLEVAAAGIEALVEPASVQLPAPAADDVRGSAAAETGTAASDPPKAVSHHRDDRKPKSAASARPKSRTPEARKPQIKAANVGPAHVKAAHSGTARTRTADSRRTAASSPSKPAGETGACRLKAFGGLLRALGSTDCEI